MSLIANVLFQEKGYIRVTGFSYDRARVRFTIRYDIFASKKHRDSGGTPLAQCEKTIAKRDIMAVCRESAAASVEKHIAEIKKQCELERKEFVSRCKENGGNPSDGRYKLDNLVRSEVDRRVTENAEGRYHEAESKFIRAIEKGAVLPFAYDSLKKFDDLKTANDG